MAWLAEQTGVEAAPGGPHPGEGTRNALLALDGGRYLEVIAPDPEQPLEHNLGAGLAGLPAPRLLTFALRTDDVEAAVARSTERGVAFAPVRAMSRRLPDGRELAWRLAMPAVPELAPLVPFWIDWGDAPHPSADAPAGCTLASFTARHPDPDRLRRCYEALDAVVPVSAASEPGLRAEIGAPAGVVAL